MCSGMDNTILLVLSSLIRIEYLSRRQLESCTKRSDSLVGEKIFERIQRVRRNTRNSDGILLCLLVSIRFQVLFHSPPGVLFTFPSRYYSLYRVWEGNPGNWNILVPGGKESKNDSESSGERNWRSPNRSFPSRYYSLSVIWSYLALRDGPRSFRQDSSCPDVLRISLKTRVTSCYPILNT